MTAHVYTAADWQRARSARARSGKAPRLSVLRGIALRQAPSGEWAVMIYTRRYGVWEKPEWLCRPTSYEKARAAVLQAWRRYRLPISRAPYGENRLHPFHLDRVDMIAAGAAYLPTRHRARAMEPN